MKNTQSAKPYRPSSTITTITVSGTHMMVAYSPIPRGSSFICAIKTVPTDTKSAVPSMLTVAPMGSTKREILGSTPHLSFIHRNVIGSVAALQKE